MWLPRPRPRPGPGPRAGPETGPRTRPRPGRARPAGTGLATAVWFCLAAYVAGVYACIVVVGGFVVGGSQRSEGSDIALSVVATVLVAVTYEPVRRGLRQLLRRTARFGAGSPYEVLTAFTGSLAAAGDPREVLPRLARVVGEGTGAAEVAVWLTVDDTLRQVAHWPEGTGGTSAPPGSASTPATTATTAASAAATGTVPTLGAVPRGDHVRDGPGRQGQQEGYRTVAVRHAGELLGAVSLRFAAGTATSPVEDHLVEHLAAHAGVVLRNARLGEELTARLRDVSEQAKVLRSSRQRIVAVQDAERRRLERDIHDGAQQHLVALAVQLQLAQVVLEKDPQRAAGLVAAVRPAVARARDTLTELAHGIYPPQLAAEGLPAALAAQAKAAPLPVTVVAGDAGRHPPEIEAVAYFCALEALQNAVKYAAATQVTITVAGGTVAGDAVAGDADELTVSVADDGTGFDPAAVTAGSGLANMADRVEAAGGTLDITSSAATGTTVSARLVTQRTRSQRTAPTRTAGPA